MSFSWRLGSTTAGFWHGACSSRSRSKASGSGRLRSVFLAEWRADLADDVRWRHRWGPPESPVEVAALDAGMRAALSGLEEVVAGRGLRLFVVGPLGAGKSALLSAAIAEAAARGQHVATISVGTDPTILRSLARGEVGVLAVNRFDNLAPTTRSGVLASRASCSGLVATAESLSAVTRAALTDELDVVVDLPLLEDRPRDILAISQLLWPALCGDPSADFVSSCGDDALQNLCLGPYPHGVESLRSMLQQMADALITGGDLIDGQLRRQVEARDVSDALLGSFRVDATVVPVQATPAVVVVEGTTDVTYLHAAAALASERWGWSLLEGCDVVAAGEDRRGGAEKVWHRLFELTARSVDCIGLFDNDDVGRREHKAARKQNHRAELLPPEFDRLRLPEDHRSLEIEDLICLRVVDRFYEEHVELEPEERRERAGGRRRITPQGVDKQALADWAAVRMTIEECERVVYVLCRLRRELGLPVPRDDFDEWLRDLLAAQC